MEIAFSKYQGTGNDFIIIDNRKENFDGEDLLLIKRLCDRRFGIGADGLILIKNHEYLDFDMMYYNSDGSKSFCGNGSRCAVSFTQSLGLISEQAFFSSNDGEHEAWISNEGLVSLKMNDVNNIEKEDGQYYMNTGSPHLIIVTDNLEGLNVKNEGAKIRYNDRFRKEGTNVNFICFEDDKLVIRTYERGVEDETLSCGTGATAAALCFADIHDITAGKVDIRTLGGELQVGFRKNGNKFEDIWLIGLANYVYKGVITL